MLDTEGYQRDDELKSWLAEAKKFVNTLTKKYISIKKTTGYSFQWTKQEK